MIDVVVATKNPDKVPEIEAILAESLPRFRVVRGLSWPDVAETGDALEENALIKGRAVTAATGVATIADDTGLEVDALGGRPGVNTARFAGPDAGYAQNRRALLDALVGVADRVARFRTAAAFVHPNGLELVAFGELEGSIAFEERGGHGFGYDPIFVLDDGRTLAEVGEAEKNAISHRGRALRALAALLSEAQLP